MRVCTGRCLYMGGSCPCIVACAHLRNGTGDRTVTTAALLLLTSGLARCEFELHDNVFNICR